MLAAYAVALALTLVVEVPLLTAAAPRDQRWGRAVGAALAVNLITHPVLTLTLSLTSAATAEVRPWLAWMVAEAGVVLVEGFLLTRLWGTRRTEQDASRPPRSLTLGSYGAALAANACSIAAGLLLLGRPW